MAKKKRKLKKGWHIVAKFSMAPSRAVFLGALDVNLFKLAKRLNQLWEKNPEAVEKFWYGFGGELKGLRKAVNKGLKHMQHHQEKKEARHAVGYVVTAAVVAAALPIITAVVNLFKKHKTDQPGDDKHDKIAQEKLKEAIKEDPKGKKTGVPTIVQDEKGQQIKETNTPLILAGVAAAAVAFYMIKKK